MAYHFSFIIMLIVAANTLWQDNAEAADRATEIVECPGRLACRLSGHMIRQSTNLALVRFENTRIDRVLVFKTIYRQDACRAPVDVVVESDAGLLKQQALLTQDSFKIVLDDQTRSVRIRFFSSDKRFNGTTVKNRKLARIGKGPGKCTLLLSDVRITYDAKQLAAFDRQSRQRHQTLQAQLTSAGKNRHDANNALKNLGQLRTMFMGLEAEVDHYRDLLESPSFAALLKLDRRLSKLKGSLERQSNRQFSGSINIAVLQIDALAAMVEMDVDVLSKLHLQEGDITEQSVENAFAGRLTALAQVQNETSRAFEMTVAIAGDLTMIDTRAITQEHGISVRMKAMNDVRSQLGLVALP